MTDIVRNHRKLYAVWIGITVGIVLFLLPIVVASLVRERKQGHAPVSALTSLGFNEGYGSTVHDAGELVTGTIANAVWKQEDLCLSGSCLYFDGDGGYVDFGDDDDADIAQADDVTVTLWFRHAPITSGSQTLLSKYNSTSGTDGGYRLTMQSDGDLLFEIGNDSTSFPSDSVTSTAATYDDNRWHHVAVVKTGTTKLELYIDGVLVDTDSSISLADTAANIDNLYLGIAGDGSTDDYIGFIDEVRIVRQALTATTLKPYLIRDTAEASASASFTPQTSVLSDGLVGYWKLDETSGDASDASGNGVTLTNTGTTTYTDGKFGNGSEHVPASSQHFTFPNTFDYCFDASDGSIPTWNDSANAFDCDTETFATYGPGGFMASVEGFGTNAPIDGHTIDTVEIRAYGYVSSSVYYVSAMYGGEGLSGGVDVTNTSPDWTEYFTPSAPPGGWTWQKINDLQISAAALAGHTSYLGKIEVRVTTLVPSDVRSVSFWTNPDALTNYYINLSSSANIQSNGSGVLSANGFTNPSIYVNGVKDAPITANTWQMVTVTSDTAIDADAFAIGKISTNYFDGTMDEVRLYNRALTPVEVQQLYNWAPGPVGWWKMDEGSGLAANDSSGNGYGGTLTNTTWTAGKYGPGVKLNGDGSYVGIADADAFSVQTTGQLTYEGWFRLDDLGLADYLISKHKTGNNYEWDLRRPNSVGTIACNISNPDGATSYLFASFASVYTDTGQWHHLACVADINAPSLKLYVDGVLKATDITSSGSVTNGISPVQIGETNNGDNETYGIADDVRIYNYARTPQQIIEDMNAGHPAPGSPVGSATVQWRFDESYGDTANNTGSAGSVANGNLGGGTYTCPGGTGCPTWTMHGKNNSAVVFDGSDDYILAGSDASVDNIFATGGTVTAWINASSFGETSKGRIIDKYTGTTAWFISNDATYGAKTLNFSRIFSGATGSWSTPTNSITTGQWLHVAVTYDESSDTNDPTFYINGVKQPTTEVSGYTPSGSANTDASADLFIGNRWNSGALERTFDGIIDELKIYRSVLTEDQIKEDYNQGKSVTLGSLSTDATNQASNSAQASYCPPGNSEGNCAAGLNPGPVGEWKMNEGSYINDCSTLSVSDSSGNNNSGRSCPSGVGVTAGAIGKLGKAIQLYGTRLDDRVEVPTSTSLDITNNLTIEAWIRSEGTITPGGYLTILEKADRSASPEQVQYWFSLNDSLHLQFWGKDGTGAWKSYTDTKQTVSQNVWHHIVTTYTNGTATFYIDGIQTDSGSIGLNPLLSSTGYLSIGTGFGAGKSTADTYNFAGKLDDVRIYSYVRTPAQIAWDYSRGAPIAHYKLDECQGATVYNSGTLGSTVNGTIDPGASGYTETGSCNSGVSTEMWNGGTNGMFNGSLGFDGTNDIIEFPDTNDVFDFGNGTTDQPFTLSAWVNSSVATYDILDRMDQTTGSEQFAFRFLVASNILKLYLYDQSAGQIARISTQTVPMNTWNHLLATYDGTASSNGIKLYLNGTRIDTNNDDWASYTAMESLTIPLSNYWTFSSGEKVGFLTGQIDDVRIYNYALSPVQVKTVMNEGSSVRFSGPTPTP